MKFPAQVNYLQGGVVEVMEVSVNEYEVTIVIEERFSPDSPVALTLGMCSGDARDMAIAIIRRADEIDARLNAGLK